MEEEKAWQFLTGLNEEATTAIPILTGLADQASSYRDSLERDFNWDVNSDARLTSFGKVCNSLNAATLSYVSFLEYFLNFEDGSFWRRVKEKYPEFSVNDLLVHLLSHKQATLFSLFHQVFSGVESSLRILLREQTKLIGQKADGDFQEVFDILLYEVCEFPRDRAGEYSNLLHILSTFRNCIHNNGVYIHKKPGDYIVEYGRGGIKKFEFKQGKPVKIEWDKQKVLFTHMLEMLDDIIRTDPISSEQKMCDPVTPEVFGLL